MMASNQRIWGYETNFGGLADLAVVKVNQLLPKPAHLTWEEAAVNALCNSTSYRMLVSRNGAAMKQGDVVLIWGATGGIGAYAAQYVLNGGGIPVCVVSSPEKAAILKSMGVDAVIDRHAGQLQVLEGRAHARRERVATVRQRHPRPRRRGSRHRLRTSGAFDVRRIDVRRQARWHRGVVRSNERVHARVRQPALLDAIEASHRQPLRQLQRGVGSQPADLQGHDPSGAVAGVLARTDRRSGVSGAPQHARGQARRVVPCTDRRSRRHDPELREQLGDKLHRFRR